MGSSTSKSAMNWGVFHAGMSELPRISGTFFTTEQEQRRGFRVQKQQCAQIHAGHGGKFPLGLKTLIRPGRFAPPKTKKIVSRRAVLDNGLAPSPSTR
jgi:hypothetical protein